ncbi:MAG: leucine-rich repeat domain-containing protein [Prevotella sp.]|nr:leucine-rich repeat domain-containing protein [Prevotella sp.]
MKKIFLSLLLFVFPFLASAYDAEINGIYFNLIKKARIAEVTYGNTYAYNSYPEYYSINIPEKITYEGVEYSVTSIGNSAFNGCKDLHYINIPNSISTIGEAAFSGCTNLLEVSIPNSVTSLKAHAFDGCSNLASISIPNTISSIEDGLLAGCTSLVSVTFPDNVTRIGGSAFQNCKSLDYINIPNTVTYIGPCAFLGCSGLYNIIIPNSISILYERTFEGCTNLKRVNIPNTIIIIGDYVFHQCSSLRYVTIPNNVIKLGIYSFNGCSSLKEIVIGKNVKEIGKNAFAGCHNLELVTSLPDNIPITHGDAFLNSYIEYATLYVEESILNTYKNTMPWSQFGTILPIENVSGIEYYSNNELRVFACNGLINISGLDESKQIAIYQTDGKQVATAKAYNGSASVATNISKGTPVIVKIGEKAVKVVMQ